MKSPLVTYREVFRPDSGWKTFVAGVSMSHVVMVFSVRFGGWVFDRWGAGARFAFASGMPFANRPFAPTIPKKANQGERA